MIQCEGYYWIFRGRVQSDVRYQFFVKKSSSAGVIIRYSEKAEPQGGKLILRHGETDHERCFGALLW